MYKVFLGASLLAFPCFLKAQEATFIRTVLAEGSSWKYNDNGVALPASWNTSGFNDSSWQSGAAELGFGDDDEVTTLTKVRPSGNITTAYFRKTFTLPNSGENAFYRFSVQRDDGVVIYLNGNEVFRNNMPAGAISYGTFASESVFGEAEVTRLTFDLPSTSLNASGQENTLAVEVHQVNATSSDISFDLGISEFENPGFITPGLVTSPAIMDADGDGLPDLWQGLFGAENLQPEDDADGDGVSNLVEATFGTDPFDPTDRTTLRIEHGDGDNAMVCWNTDPDRAGTLEASNDLGQTSNWEIQPGQPGFSNGEFQVAVTLDESKRFYRIASEERDSDSDGVPNWVEKLIGSKFSGTGAANSLGSPRGFDTDGDGQNDVTLSGDLAVFNDLFGPGQTFGRPTRAQAARFLLQTTFGPAGLADIDEVVNMGFEGWIENQINTVQTRTRPYIELCKANDPSVAGFNRLGSGNVSGRNFLSSWMRAAVNNPDQLRQRVAYALSQILVANEANQPIGVTSYYDNFIEEAFGNYEDLLLKQSLHPVMGLWLSHLGNRKADPSIGRFPDENFGREIMQLFTIGLWELNLDGTRRVGPDGNFIPTYNNDDITQIARVFTGTNYGNDASGFGGGFRDDGRFISSPMRVWASQHDFGRKLIPNGARADGSRIYTTIPAQSGNPGNVDARRDVVLTVASLVRHPNTAPFICRQLIQFLVTSNPTPEYVARVASVFRNNGSGTVGDLGAVVKAILLDSEARRTNTALGIPYYGKLKEPIIRTVQLARATNFQRFDNLRFFDFDKSDDQSYFADALQEPNGSNTVFNFYRPDYRHPGEISNEDLTTPVFGILNSYSAIAFPNRIWVQCDDGFTYRNQYRFEPDYSAYESIAADADALLDRLSLLYCAGGLTAKSREIIKAALPSTANLPARIRVAHYAVLMSPEGSCLR